MPGQIWNHWVPPQLQMNFHPGGLPCPISVSDALVPHILISFKVIQGDSHEHCKGIKTWLRVIWIRQSGNAPGSGSREKIMASAVNTLAWGSAATGAAAGSASRSLAVRSIKKLHTHHFSRPIQSLFQPISTLLTYTFDTDSGSMKLSLLSHALCK